MCRSHASACRGASFCHRIQRDAEYERVAVRRPSSSAAAATAYRTSSLATAWPSAPISPTSCPPIALSVNACPASSSAPTTGASRSTDRATARTIAETSATRRTARAPPISSAARRVTASRAASAATWTPIARMRRTKWVVRSRTARYSKVSQFPLMLKSFI